MLTKKINRARLDCIIFFYIIANGWKIKELSKQERLNYPSRKRIINASKRVRATCPDLANEYKKTYRDIRECSKRYGATLSEKSWKRYKSLLAYDWHVAKKRSVTKAEFFHDHLYAYTYEEIFKDKLKERRKALKEFKALNVIIKELEESIFINMEVPLEYRRGSMELKEIKKELEK